MKRIIIAGVLVVPLVFLVDFLVTIVHARVFRTRIASEEIMPALCKKVRPGMSQSEVEGQIVGFREVRSEPRDQGYVIAYGYWFGFIPPLGKSEFKLIGEVVVSYSTDKRVKDCSFWYN